jgi:hypothetical protein
MKDEPEAVPVDQQKRLTELAHRRELQRRVDAWKTARSVITAALVGFQPFADPSMKSDLRLVTRACEKIDRRLAAQ